VDVSTAGQVSEAEMIFPSTFCVPRAGAYADFLETVVVFIDGSLTSVLPFCIILMCNIVLSLSLRQAYREIRQRMSTAGMSNQRSRRDDKMISTILTVLTISTMFLVLTLLALEDHQADHGHDGSQLHPRPLRQRLHLLLQPGHLSLLRQQRPQLLHLLFDRLQFPHRH
jgi:hypothetical protein